MSSADRRDSIGTSVAWLRSAFRRYAFALITVGVATLLRAALDKLLGPNVPFIVFYPVIWLVAWMAGLGPGLFAVFLSAVSAHYLFFGPVSPSGLGLPQNANGLILFSIAGAALGGLANVYRRRGQGERDRSVSYLPIWGAGRVERVAAVLRDITERKRTEDALGENEDRYHDLVEHSEDLLCTHDLEGRLLTVNPAPARVLGYTVDELLKIPMRDLIIPEGRELFDAYLERLRTTGAPEKGLLCVITKSGEVRTWQYHNTLRTDGVGQPVVRGMAHDITEQRRAELALREREEDYRRFVAQSSEGIFREEPITPIPVDLPVDEVIARIRRDCYVTECNEALAKMYGFGSAQEMIGKRLGELVTDDPENLEIMRDYVRAGFRLVERRSHEVDHMGNPKVFLNSMNGIVESGMLLRTWGMQRDITEQVRLEKARGAAENALRRSEEHFRILVEQASDLIAIADAQGNWIDVNSVVTEILGFTREEFLQCKVGANVVEEEQPRVVTELARLSGGQALRSEFRVRRKNGSLVPMEILAKRLPDGRVQVIARDVGERKRAEEALRSSEQRYRLLFEKNIAGVAIASMDGRVLDCNDGWARILGYESADQVRGRPTSEFYFNPADREPLLEALGKGESFSSREMQLRRKDESPVWVLFSCGVVHVSGGEAMLQATMIDISERKQSEQALRESEERFRGLYENSTIGIYRTTPDGRILLANPSLVKMLGFSSFSELAQRNLEEEGFEPGYERADFRRRLETGGEIRGIETSWTRKDGTAVFIRESARAIRDAEGNLVFYEGTVEDVTERKQAEDLVRRSEERFRVALKDSPITVFNQDRDLRYTWIYNPSLCWQREIVGRTDDEIMGASQARYFVALKRRVLETATGLREEVVIPHNGNRYSFDVTLEPLRDAAGNVVGITGAAMDIARLRELADSLQKAKDRLVQEKRYLESEIRAELGFENIIGQSPALQAVLKDARVVAPTDSTVLLLGETGTGKELVARAIHSLSARQDKNFIKLNCAAVPTGLLESELFGHEKGAFTSAVNQKIGRLELADKGTLFLDEIGELPLELQPKLLRVLQDREFERLGGVRTLRVDVRVISATNRDLREDVEQKRFREDLFYRLNVFPILLPPLRERRTDVPLLVCHCVQKYAAGMGKRIETIPDETMSVLENWSWPGNIRELENMIERMVILTKGEVLAAPPPELDAPQELSRDDLTEMEREHIIRILHDTNGVLSGENGAASRLGIKRTTLQSMLKRFGIDPQEFRRSTGTFGRE